MDVQEETESAELIAPSAYLPEAGSEGPGQRSGTSRIFRQILPTLNRILEGGSSVSFDLLGKRAAMQNPAPFFSKKGLNDVVIFKFPNFGLSPARNRMEKPWTKYFRAAAGQPVETGLFRPYSVQDPTMGGLAIYLRQPDFIELLTQHMGFDLTAEEDDEVQQDRKRLEILDGIPSLDPFLMKYAFDEAGLPCDAQYLNLTAEEEYQTRITIERQISPIIGKAIPTHEDLDGHTSKMVDFLWEPNGVQAARFLEAFRLGGDQREDVLSGFRGVCYYRSQIDDKAREARALLAWLRSSRLDATSRRTGDAANELVAMLKGTILSKVTSLLQQMADIFHTYDDAVAQFVEHNDPALLRQFLLSTKDKYWFLGRSTSSLRHICDLKKQVEASDDLRKLSLDQLARTLLYMQYSLR